MFCERHKVHIFQNCVIVYSVTANPEKNIFILLRIWSTATEVNGESPLDFNGFEVMLAVRKNILELIALLPLGHFSLSFGIGKDESCKTHS